MSSDIYILELDGNEISLEIRANSIGIRVSDPDENAVFNFNMTNKQHVTALQNMIEILQDRMKVHLDE